MRRAVLLVAVTMPSLAHGYGEEVDGFPSWPERVIFEWANRARVEPSIEMTACGSACAEGGCYQPMGPLAYGAALHRSARFHAANMGEMGFFGHDSRCKLAANVGSTYPGSCDAAAACACATTPPDTCTYSGPEEPSPTCTRWSERVALFGISPSGEIIASSPDPNTAFYQWLYESFPDDTCDYVQGPPTNGHRWLILTSTGAFGAGVNGRSVGDFGSGGVAYRIPSGSHYPRQAASVEVWANWSDADAPQRAMVDVDGTCTTMTLQRGTGTNGAWSATVTGVGSGCHRYLFAFVDSGGGTVLYPTTGSLGIGPAGSCADWDPAPLALGPGCDDAPAPDAGVGTPDARAPDAAPDAGVGTPDARAPDASLPPDASKPDAAVKPPDASLPDASKPDAAVVSDGPLPDGPLPADAAGSDGPIAVEPDAGVPGIDARPESQAAAGSPSGCACTTGARPRGPALPILVFVLFRASARSRRGDRSAPR